MENSEILKRMDGRTPEQKQVIKYFYNWGGCLEKKLKDEEYDEMIKALIKSMDFRKKALSKIGLDESQVSEIEPVNFEGYRFDEEKTLAKYGMDKVWRSSAYQVSWIFFSSSQIYVYQYTFNMDEDGKKESTEEFFYKDITNFSTSSDTIEKYVMVKGKSERKSVDTNRFAIIVPGDKFYCALDQNDATERAIQGMKSKLREMKA